jgi:DNA repair exonuclease SbcCD nuclease subunit
MRNDSAAFRDYFELFYRDVLFPYIDEHGINTIVQLGDLFDRRKYVNFNTLSDAKRVFFNEMQQRDIQFYTLIGNHDIFFRNTLEVNSPQLLLSEYKNITIIDAPVEADFGGVLFDMIPWICDDNREIIMSHVKNSNAPFCFGHLELSGFEMDRGNWCHEGMDMTLFNRYELVMSGHFHHKSQKGNILYTGVHGQMTWADWNDPKGFHIFDTETRELEFITNPHEIYIKLPYNDDELYFDDVTKHDFSAYTGKYVKVVVVKKNNAFLFETLMDLLQKANPIDVTVVEDFSDTGILASDEEINQADDTMAIIDKVIDGMEIDLQKPRLKSILRAVYTEALAVES